MARGEKQLCCSAPAMMWVVRVWHTLRPSVPWSVISKPSVDSPHAYCSRFLAVLAVVRLPRPVIDGSPGGREHR